MQTRLGLQGRCEASQVESKRCVIAQPIRFCSEGSFEGIDELCGMALVRTSKESMKSIGEGNVQTRTSEWWQSAVKFAHVSIKCPDSFTIHGISVSSILPGIYPYLLLKPLSDNEACGCLSS